MRYRTPLSLAALLLLLPQAGALAAQSRTDNPYLREVPDSADTDTVEAEIPDRAEAPPRRAMIHREESSFPRRGGYYASFGVGVGGEAIADLGAPAPYTPSRIRPTLSIGVGAGLGQSVRLGLEGFAWFNLTGDGALETVTTAMIAARVYPIATSGLYLRAGGGFGRYGVDLQDYYCDCSYPITQDYGLAWSVGGGYELPVGRGLWLGPSVELVRMDVSGPAGYRERVLNFGLTLTFDGHH